MDYSIEIDRAIVVHGMWKRLLTLAIETGLQGFRVEQVKEDKACDFGKWFYGLSVQLRETEEGKTIRRLHAAFHEEAARILEIALQGNKDEALMLLKPGSRYITISGQLASLLTIWKANLKREHMRGGPIT